MTEQLQESEKLRKLAKVLKELDNKYQLFKHDRTELLKFVEFVLPSGENASEHLNSGPGKIEFNILLALYKSTDTFKMKEELELLRRSRKVMEERMNKIEEQTKKLAKNDGNVLLARIKSFNNPNQSLIMTSGDLIESLQREIHNQNEQIASLQSQLLNTSVPSTAVNQIPRVKNTDVSTQAEIAELRLDGNAEGLEGEIVKLQRALEAVQYEYNVI